MEMNKESLQSCDAQKKFWGGLVSRWMRSWPASLFLRDILKLSAQCQIERKWKDPQRKHRKALKVESISQCWPFFVVSRKQPFLRSEKQKRMSE